MKQKHSRRLVLRTGLVVLLTGAGSLSALAQKTTNVESGFDQTHLKWTRLLAKHVQLIDGGNGSVVDYQGFVQDKTALEQYLAELSAVTQAEFDRFTSAQQQAFLINAYNAFTVELILSRYPDLDSIKDLGSLFTSPWAKSWIVLLGRTQSLDDIEHGLLREPGRYNEPLVHFAVNCASIGCPMLREEAFVAEQLEAQLLAQAERFMADKSRNRFDANEKTLYLSKIFDWYGEDFEQGFRGISSVTDFARQYAKALAPQARAREVLLNEPVSIRYLSYDWDLNRVIDTNA